MPDRPVAFVIMPFGREFDDVYRLLIQAPLEAAGYEARRADSDLSQKSIMDTIVVGISTADLVVADLTALNANVMYELGVSHALGRPVIMICQQIEDIPFDLRAYRLLQYSTYFGAVESFKKRLRELAEERAKGSLEFTNPVSDYLKKPVDFGPVSGSGCVESDRDQDDETEPGLIDHLAAGEEAGSQLTELLQSMSDRTEAMGDRIRQYTKQTQSLTGANQVGTASQLKHLFSSAAAAMQEYARSIDKDHPQLQRHIQVISDTYTYMIGHLGDSNQGDVQREKIRGQLNTLLASVTSSLESMRGYRDAVASLAENGVSRSITSASRTMSRSLDLVCTDFSVLEAFCTKTLSLIDQRATN